MRELKFPSGASVILGDIRFISPAFDITPEGVLVMGVTLPGTRPAKSRVGDPARPDLILCCVSSEKWSGERWLPEPELFECTLEELTARGWFARMPATAIPQRWSAASLEAFLKGEAPKPDPHRIFSEIRKSWVHYMDLTKNEGAEVFLSLWVMGTYFYVLFSHYPYVKFSGPRGSGKTKAGRICAALAFNCAIFARATPAAIYRYSADTRGTMVIDEAENLSSESEELQAYFQVLNAGFQRDATVFVTHKDSHRVETLPAYSPKVICSIAGMRDTLEDRAIEVTLVRSLRREITNRDPPETNHPEWQALRDALYLTCFAYWREVRALYEQAQNDENFDGRFWSLVRPIFALVRLVDKYRPEGEEPIEPQLRAFLRKVVRSKNERLQESDHARIVALLYDILRDAGAGDDYPHRVSLKEIVEKGVEVEGEWFREAFRPRRVANILRSLHLYDDPRRTSKGGGWTFRCSLREVKEVAGRYGLELEPGSEYSELSEPSEPFPTQAASSDQAGQPKDRRVGEGSDGSENSERSESGPQEEGERA